MAERNGSSDGAVEVPTPRETENLVGHDEAERRLAQLWQAGRWPHALLITGPQGIGKATLAYRLARVILGGKVTDGSDWQVPAGDPVFRRVASGGHTDLVVVERPVDEKTGKVRAEITVNEVRKAVRFVRHTSGEGDWRVVIVDAADDLNRSAANALLKILEEPPRQVAMLLVAHAPGRLLPTIRSRCRNVPLQPLSPPDMARVLAGNGSGDADTSEVLALAAGRPGSVASIAAHGGLATYRDMMGLLDPLPRLDVAGVLKFADRFGRAGTDDAFAVFQGLWLDWLARLVRHGASGRDTTTPSPREADLNRQLAAAGPLDPWLEVWENTRAAFARTDGLNLDRRQTVLSMFQACAEAASGAASGRAIR